MAWYIIEISKITKDGWGSGFGYKTTSYYGAWRLGRWLRVGSALLRFAVRVP